LVLLVLAVVVGQDGAQAAAEAQAVAEAVIPQRTPPVAPAHLAKEEMGVLEERLALVSVAVAVAVQAQQALAEHQAGTAATGLQVLSPEPVSLTQEAGEPAHIILLVEMAVPAGAAVVLREVFNPKPVPLLMVFRGLQIPAAVEAADGDIMLL
jgi:hypothetical protein